MSTVKISSLSALTTPAASDSFVVVDVSDTSGSANGTTKKITFADIEAALSFLTAAGTATLTNKTYDDPVVTGSITEQVYAISGTTPALDPANGTIQTWTLSANSSPTDSLATGQYIALFIDDGAGYTITWPTITWLDGSAPTLATTGYTNIQLIKIGSTLYGKYVGEG